MATEATPGNSFSVIIALLLALIDAAGKIVTFPARYASRHISMIIVKKLVEVSLII